MRRVTVDRLLLVLILALVGTIAYNAFNLIRTLADIAALLRFLIYGTPPRDD